MQQLAVTSALNLDKNSHLELVSAHLDNIEKQPLAYAPWPAFSYKPAVYFALAYGPDALFLKYYVTEHNARAIYRRTNDPVYKDSCVEFFLAFEKENEYYNLECNLLGTIRLGFGAKKENRKLLPAAAINQIKRYPSIKTFPINEQEPTTWELTLIIPAEVFIYHQLSSFKDKTGKANFYKCGDDLPQPHFLAWQNIKSAKPNFHLPEFFGEIYFQ